MVEGRRTGFGVGGSSPGDPCPSTGDEVGRSNTEGPRRARGAVYEVRVRRSLRIHRAMRDPSRTSKARPAAAIAGISWGGR